MSMNILEVMQQRRSIRNYDGMMPAPELQCELQKIAHQVYSPFGGRVEIRMAEFDTKGDFKPSTYGVIRGAREYFLVAYADDMDSALSAGFKFEQVVLAAWQMGLGTCWIGGTFRGSDFDRQQSWAHGVELKVVCPVGYGTKSGVRERLTRYILGSKNRKEFDSMFFFGDFHGAVPADNRYREALEMMRLAPSSTNSQPWRALVIGDAVHFYCKQKGKLSVLDCGIGISHFYLTEQYRGRSGRFERQADAPLAPSGWIYLTSFVGEQGI